MAIKGGEDSGGNGISRTATFSNDIDLTYQQEEMTVNSHTNDQDLVIPVQDEEERLNILLEKMSNDNESGDSDNGIDMNNEINDELDPSTNEVSGTSFVTFNGQQ